MKLELYKLVIGKGGKELNFDKEPLVLFKSMPDLDHSEDDEPPSNGYTSIYIGPDYKAVVYSGINYTGIKEKLFLPGRYDYVGDDWNNKIISIKLLKKDDPYTSPEEKAAIVQKQLEKEKFEEQMTPILYALFGGGILILLFFLYVKMKTGKNNAPSAPVVGGFKKIFKKFKKLF
jgi:hypothetical protein